jgi:hypothetical protein
LNNDIHCHHTHQPTQRFREGFIDSFQLIDEVEAAVFATGDCSHQLLVMIFAEPEAINCEVGLAKFPLPETISNSQVSSWVKAISQQENAGDRI